MPDEHQPHAADGRPVNPEVRSEQTDANVPGLLWFGVIMIVLAAVAHLVVAWFFFYLGRREEAARPPQPVVARGQPQLPADLKAIPPPRLQQSSERDLERYLKEQKEILATRAEVDP